MFSQSAWNFCPKCDEEVFWNHDRDSVFMILFLRLRRYIKHARQCVTTFSKTSNLSKILRFASYFRHSSVFESAVKFWYITSSPKNNVEQDTVNGDYCTYLPVHYTSFVKKQQAKDNFCYIETAKQSHQNIVMRFAFQYQDLTSIKAYETLLISSQHRQHRQNLQVQCRSLGTLIHCPSLGWETGTGFSSLSPNK